MVEEHKAAREREPLRISKSTVKSVLSEYSISNYIFFFGEQGITQFNNGGAIDENNIFYSRSDRMKYREKKDISQIQEVMDNYARQYLTQQVNYMTLFADRSTIMQIDPQLVKNNI